MDVVIAFNPIEEARLSAAAKRIGLGPSEYVKKLIDEHLPVATDDDAIDDPTLALFAQWDHEDANMTPEEVEHENRTWEEFKANINAERKRTGARELF